jgi:hypothetical protein
LDRPRSEARTGPVDRPIGLAPTVVGLVQTGLDGGALQRHELFHAHPDQPDSSALETEGVEERDRGFVDLATDVGGLAKGA